MRCDVRYDVRCDVVRCGGVGTPQLGSFSTKLPLVVGNKTWTTVPHARFEIETLQVWALRDHQDSLAK